MNKELQQVSRVTKNQLFWKIENFSSLLMNPGEFIRSAVVKNSDCHWCLKLYPNGKVFSNQIQLNLETVGFAFLPSGVEYKIGFRDIFGHIRDGFRMSIPKCAGNSGAGEIGNSCASASTAAGDSKANVSRLLNQSAVSGIGKDANPAKNKTTDSTGSFPGSISNFETLSKSKGIQFQQTCSLSNISTKAHSSCFLDEMKKCVDSNTTSQLFFEAIQGVHVSRDHLFKDKDKLFPNDVLTVICEMKITSAVHVSQPSRVKEDASAVGTMLLTKNLEDAFENPRFSDVTLKVGDAEFPAHKVILANRSKVFDGMFCSGMKENQENVVNLVEMKPSTAESMLRYIYTGKIQELSMDRATDLYVAADRYDMPELKQWCKDFILRHISPDAVCDVAVLANLHGDEDLQKATKRIIRNNLKTVLNSEKWLSCSKDSPAFYLEMLQVALLDNSN